MLKRLPVMRFRLFLPGGQAQILATRPEGERYEEYI